jgi:transcriptional regulator with XRE-family HTH domain
MITPEATRAGRGLLGWSLETLANKSEVSFGTLTRFENGRPMRDTTAAKILAAFAAHGVDVTADADKTGAVLVYARRAG